MLRHHLPHIDAVGGQRLGLLTLRQNLDLVLGRVLRQWRVEDVNCFAERARHGLERHHAALSEPRLDRSAHANSPLGVASRLDAKLCGKQLQCQQVEPAHERPPLRIIELDLKGEAPRTHIVGRDQAPASGARGRIGAHGPFSAAGAAMSEEETGGSPSSPPSNAAGLWRSSASSNDPT